jgi:hypothetical protein
MAYMLFNTYPKLSRAFCVRWNEALDPVAAAGRAAAGVQMDCRIGYAVNR